MRNWKRLMLGAVMAVAMARGAEAQTSSAVDADAQGWKHESEASIVRVGGNTSSDSSSAKQKTSYKSGFDSWVLAGRYLESKTAGVETGRAWDASLRYERELSPKWSIFFQQGAESDVFAGYLQRDNTDFGGKYFFDKSSDGQIFAEAGARRSQVLNERPDRFGRFYGEIERKTTETVTARLWFEYLPNLDDPEAWLLNYEPSMSVMLNRIFSLKLAYLVKRHNLVAAPAESKDDTTFTTALVAKF